MKEKRARAIKTNKYENNSIPNELQRFESNGWRPKEIEGEKERDLMTIGMPGKWLRRIKQHSWNFGDDLTMQINLYNLFLSPNDQLKMEWLTRENLSWRDSCRWYNRTSQTKHIPRDGVSFDNAVNNIGKQCLSKIECSVLIIENWTGKIRRRTEDDPAAMHQHHIEWDTETRSDRNNPITDNYFTMARMWPFRNVCHMELC